MLWIHCIDVSTSLLLKMTFLFVLLEHGQGHIQGHVLELKLSFITT